MGQMQPAASFRSGQVNYLTFFFLFFFTWEKKCEKIIIK